MFQQLEDPMVKYNIGMIAAIASFFAAVVALIGVALNVRLIRRNHTESLESQKKLKLLETDTALEIKKIEASFNTYLAEETQKHEAQLEEKRQSFQKDLEAIRSSFDDENAGKRARRDYEYEARKRLYIEFEPLLFQLTEKGEDALFRILGIAFECKLGNLRTSGGRLSDQSHYYSISNMYKLIAPLTVVKLMQQKLTMVDLKLVPQINSLYTISKIIPWTLSSDFLIKYMAKLDYDPNHENWEDLRIKNPSVYWRQGVPTAQLDRAISLLIDDRTGQCMSFGEFEDKWKDQKSTMHATFEIIFDLFRDFHPKTRPILWRILIIQAHLYHALARNRDEKLATDSTSKLVIPLNPLKKLHNMTFDWDEPFDWRQHGNEASEEEVYLKPFGVAEIFLHHRLKGLFDDSFSSDKQIEES